VKEAPIKVEQNLEVKIFERKYFLFGESETNDFSQSFFFLFSQTTNSTFLSR